MASQVRRLFSAARSCFQVTLPPVWQFGAARTGCRCVVLTACTAVGLTGSVLCQSGPDRPQGSPAPPPSALAPLPPAPVVGRGGSSPGTAFRRLFTSEDGWFARLGGLGEGNGIAAGGGYRVATGTDGMLTLRSLVSVRESYLTSAEYRHTLDPARRWAVVASVARRRDAQQLFAGTGPRPADQTTGYALEATSAGAALEWRPGRWVAVQAGVSALQPRLLDSTDDDIGRVSNRFTPREAVGLLRQPTFGVFHGGVRVDVPGGRRGAGSGVYAVDWRRYDDREDGRFSFSSVRADAVHEWALGDPGRSIGVHAQWHQTWAGSTAAVPFYFQPTLGGGRSLRGYDRQRFRDLAALLLQAEYSHRVHRYVRAAAFVDAGQVAPGWTALRPSALQTNYGFGLRLGRAGSPSLRTDVALGGDVPVRLVVGFTSTF
jgi:hypothetical protein